MDPDPQTVGDKFDDEHYPAYTMGGAAELLGVTQSFLRSLDEAKLMTRDGHPADTAATPATNCE